MRIHYVYAVGPYHSLTRRNRHKFARLTVRAVTLLPAMRGIGRLYLRGDVWWFQIGVAGKKYRTTTGLRGGTPEHPPKEVELWRARKLTELGKGNINALHSESLTLNPLLDSLEARYAAEQRPSLVNLVPRIKHLRERLGSYKIPNLTPSAILTYAVQRRDKDGVAIATVNLELAFLRRAFAIGFEDGLLQIIPKVPRLPGTHVRQGFLEGGQIIEVIGYLSERYRGLVWFLWYTGWRLREGIDLTWDRVSWPAQEIRLDTSKNGEPRTLPFGTYPELGSVLKEALTRNPFGRVFPVPISSFRHAWNQACEKAGCPGRLIHDLRRSFVRRCEQMGLPRSVAMAVTGHRSEAVYRRYAVICKRDVEDGLAKLSGSQEAGCIRKFGSGQE